ncbi:MAG: hypothetical protein EOP20_05135 [Hyphomicrobiales bacterium]|nr:MAG: hypothetical protein EOP20_05135 [Hyphomicrobiales bacterium]
MLLIFTTLRCVADKAPAEVAQKRQLGLVKLLGHTLGDMPAMGGADTTLQPAACRCQAQHAGAAVLGIK